MPAEPKTKRTKASVAAFLNAIEDDRRRQDAKAVVKLMQEATGEKPAMWGEAIVGFGEYMAGANPWPKVGFSPRKTSLTLYSMGNMKASALLKQLGKHKLSGSCLHFNKLADVDEAVLGKIVATSFANMTAKHG